MQPAISVIIPTFNRQCVLSRALDSVLGQTLAPLEILVVDDGSCDKTEELIRTAYRKVRYVRQPNQGVSAARNRGIQNARGEWIALLDSDDQWLPRKLERQWAALQGNPEMKICHTDEIWIRHGRRVNPKRKHAKRGGWIFRHCLPLCAMSPSSILLHCSLFDAVGLFDETLPACEDYDLWLRITACFPVLYIEEPLLVKYGGHSDQLSRCYWGMDRFRIKALEKILTQGNLANADRLAALAMLEEKARILATGARKRGKMAEADYYENLPRKYLCPTP